MSEVSRRSFVKRAGGSILSASVAAGTGRILGANERVVLALVGGRNRGIQVARGFIEAGAEIKTICDIDKAINEKVGAEVADRQKRRPLAVKDFRSVLDDPEIDAVIIATPDHWHAIQMIQACQAGKDIYVEKPLSQTIHEGRLMRDAARHYERVVQVGTQRRSQDHYRTAVEYVASGRLGKLCLIKAWMYQVRESIGNPANSSVPPGVDYDMWLGPAPNRPFNRNHFHYNWRFFWEYGNSELGNQGVHMLDIAMWAIQKIRGLDHCLPGRVSGSAGIYWLEDAKRVPDTQVLTYDFEDFMLVWELHSFQRHSLLDGKRSGTTFYGNEATLTVDWNGWTVTDKEGNRVKDVPSSSGSHQARFLECLKSRQKPNADIELGRLSTTICHLGNIAYHLGRDVKFDPNTEKFGNDSEANALLTKEYRAPYLLPQI